MSPTDPSPAAAVAAPCPLCGQGDAPTILHAAGRTYHQCPGCDLIFLDPTDRLAPLAEVMRYLEHNNDRHDPEYIRFLRRLGDQVVARVPPGARGLDFGCGPVPALGEWLTAQGRHAESYDPLFQPDEGLLEQRYDFVTCSEVVEHAHDPAAMFATLAGLLRPAGMLAVMTRFHGVEASFDRWWYRRDPTHVCFYSGRTMHWIGRRFGWAVELPVPHIALFTPVQGTATRVPASPDSTGPSP